MGTLTLTEFVLARIADDKRDAREYGDDDSPGTWRRRYGEDVADALGRIVDEHGPDDCGEHCRTCAHPEDELAAGAPWPCRTLRFVAGIYSDHEDYDESWTP